MAAGICYSLTPLLTLQEIEMRPTGFNRGWTRMAGFPESAPCCLHEIKHWVFDVPSSAVISILAPNRAQLTPQFPQHIPYSLCFCWFLLKTGTVW